MNIFKAITELHSNVTTIRELDGVYTAETADGTEVALDMDAVNTKLDELVAAAEAEAAQKETDSAVGNQKLLDLGLTQAEATALTGYTPPSE